MTVFNGRRYLLAVLLFAGIALALALGAQGRVLLEQDDFNGTTGDPPNTSIWSVYKDSNDVVILEGNTLRTSLVSGGVAYAYCDNIVPTKNFTILVDWKATSNVGRPMDIRVVSQWGIYLKDWICFNYDPAYYGWTLGYRKNAAWTPTYSYSRNVNANTWYTLNVTFNYDRVNVSAIEKSTGDRKSVV